MILRLLGILGVFAFWAFFVYHFPILKLIEHSTHFLIPMFFFLIMSLFQLYMMLYSCEIYVEGNTIIAKNSIAEHQFKAADIQGKSVGMLGFTVKFKNDLGKTQKVFVLLNKLTKTHTVRKLNEAFDSH